MLNAVEPVNKKCPWFLQNNEQRGQNTRKTSNLRRSEAFHRPGVRDTVTVSALIIVGSRPLNRSLPTKWSIEQAMRNCQEPETPVRGMHH